ncbi:MAG: hypothetical protein IBX61_09595 [Thermoleophilia bacterium]|nr:hypothetical protein [Thermoleophilia bacterium]
MADQINKTVRGFWLNGRFYPTIAGGSGDDGEGDGASSEGGEEGSTDGDDQDPGSGSSGDDEESDDSSEDVEMLKKEIAKLRKENAKRRTDSRDARKAKDETEKKLKAIAKALGVEGDDEPDVDALQKKLDKASAEMKSLKIERAISRAAKKHGADAEALADSRSFLQDAEALDLDDDGFAGELDSLVEAAVKNNPKLKTSQAPGKSGGDFGGSGGGGQSMSLDAAVAKGDKDAINKAMDAALKAGRK